MASPAIGPLRRTSAGFGGTCVPRQASPAGVDGQAVADFLTHLAADRNVSVSTQRQASSALLFLYEQVLGLPVEVPAAVLRPARPRRLPTVLSRGEVRAVLDEVREPAKLVCGLLYGAGMRLMEALSIRVQDLSIERNEIVVHDGKGGRDRVAILPASLADTLRRQVTRVLRRHAADLQGGGGWVDLPDAFGLKASSVGRDPGWQYLFPGARTQTDRKTQVRGERVPERVARNALSNASLAAGTGHLKRRASLGHIGLLVDVPSLGERCAGCGLA